MAGLYNRPVRPNRTQAIRGAANDSLSIAQNHRPAGRIDDIDKENGCPYVIGGLYRPMPCEEGFDRIEDLIGHDGDQMVLSG
jgi:hypothetical protein